MGRASHFTEITDSNADLMQKHHHRCTQKSYLIWSVKLTQKMKYYQVEKSRSVLQLENRPEQSIDVGTTSMWLGKEEARSDQASAGSLGAVVEKTSGAGLLNLLIRKHP